MSFKCASLLCGLSCSLFRLEHFIDEKIRGPLQHRRIQSDSGQTQAKQNNTCCTLNNSFVVYFIHKCCKWKNEQALCYSENSSCYMCFCSVQRCFSQLYPHLCKIRINLFIFRLLLYSLRLRSIPYTQIKADSVCIKHRGE